MRPKFWIKQHNYESLFLFIKTLESKKCNNELCNYWMNKFMICVNVLIKLGTQVCPYYELHRLSNLYKVISMNL